MLLDQHPYLPIRSADLALHDTGALAAAEYGRPAVWAHSPLFSGLGAASTTAGRCIRCWCSTSTVGSIWFLIFKFLSPVSCVCAPSSFFPKRAKSVRPVVFVCLFFLPLLFFPVCTSPNRTKRKTAQCSALKRHRLPNATNTQQPCTVQQISHALGFS